MEKTTYRHFAIKALAQSGIEKISQIQIDFDPSYSQVVMHNARVFREGKWIDRLDKARCNLIQRETELEQNLYNGDFTLIYFLDDIREGDILEYSYSLLGEHSFFSSHYTGWVYLQRDYPVERITYRLLASPDLCLRIKSVNTTAESQIRDLSPSLREWSWEAVNPSVYSFESDEPVWYNLPAHIEMSQYQNWEELVKKIYPLYVLPSDFAQSIPEEMMALVEQWKGLTKESSERALLALRFVQDKIRYLGIEEGMWAFKPKDPCLTFQGRFGDCKDKAFLLHALLQLMDIPSSPILVHSRRGRLLPDLLPAPFEFNHLVLQLEINGTIYYVDPTISLQGGSLETNSFPDYGWGLVLSDHSKELTRLPQVVFKSPTEIDSSFILESEDLAQLKIKCVFYDSHADRLRRSLEWRGAKKIEEDGLSDLQQVYGPVTLDTVMQVSDNREENIITLSQSYHLLTESRSGKKVMETFSYIFDNYIDRRVNPERASPYQLRYPLWVKERISIDNPFNQWSNFEEDYKQEHESILYNLSTQITKNRAVFNLELKHLLDHVPKNSLRNYWQTINEINRKSLPKMTIALLSDPSQIPRFSLCYSISAFCLWLVLYFLNKKKKSTTQDMLIFHLSKFQNFYAAINILTLRAINDSTTDWIVQVIVALVLAAVVCNQIMWKKSTQGLLILQAFLVVHASLLSYFLLTRGGMQLIDKVVCLCVIGLFFSTLWVIITQITSHLLQKKERVVSAEL